MALAWVCISCTDEVEFETIVEIVEQPYELVIEGQTFFQVITRKNTHAPGGELLNTEVTAVTIDGQLLAKDGHGKWIWQHELSRVPVAGGAVSSIPDCTTEILSQSTAFLMIIGESIDNAVQFCDTTFETTCFETHIENGIMVTEVTYSIGTITTSGPC